MSIEKRLKYLEEVISKHLAESGSIQTNLKWNTVLTGIILTAVVARLCVEFFFRR